ncbi:MAG TPA: hypothetical protein VGM23_04685 [Armatimonadota bacterium]|jgi:hypothetical protein
MKKLFVLGLLVALASAVYALPTVFGPTGGFYVPSTGIQSGVALCVSENLDGGHNIPLTQLNWGVLPNLEVGVGYLDEGYFNSNEYTTWGVNAKYVLPFSIAKGKLAIAAVYNEENYPNGIINEEHGLLIGSWPVFGASTFTAAADFMAGDAGKDTAYLFGLTKDFKNGSVLGLEYYFNMNTSYIFDGVAYGSEDFGTAYISFPINEMLSGRVALTDIGDSKDGTSMFASVGAKF